MSDRSRARVRTSEWWRRAASVAAVLAAAVASLATSQAPPQVSADHEERVELTQQRPVVARRLTAAVANRDPSLSRVTLHAEAWLEGPQNQLVAPPNVSLLLVPEGPGPQVDDELYTEGPTLDLTDGCRQQCREGILLLARLLDDAPATILLRAWLYAEGEIGEGELDADVSLDAVDAPEFAAARTGASDGASGTFRIGFDSHQHVERLTVRVAGGALREPLAFPLVGRLRIALDTVDASHHPNAHLTTVDVLSESYMLVEEQQSIEVDFLPACRSGTACEIEVVLRSEYDATMNREDPDPSGRRAGFVELEWTVDARLEAFDGRPIPADAVQIVALPRER